MRSVMRIVATTLFSIALSMTSLGAISDSDLERSNLSKLINEIDFLVQRVERFSQEPTSDQRIKFSYSILKSDLLKIRSGLNQHIAKALDTGRYIEPLSGHYNQGVHH